MEISERIRLRRLELDLTLEDVAEKLGVTKSTVLRYETGYIKNMGIDKVEDLARVLKCSPAYLMGWEVHKTNIGYTINDGEDDIVVKLIDETKDLSASDIQKLIEFAKIIKR